MSKASRELRKDCQVGVQPNPVKTANAEREESPLMLEAAELTLDTAARGVQLLAALALARDERVQPVGLDPLRRRGADAGGAAPLGTTPLRVSASEHPLAMLAARRLVLAALGAGRLLERGDGRDTPVHAPLMERV